MAHRIVRISAALCTFGCLAAFAQPSTPAFFRKVGIDQKLNAQVPLELHLEDENAHTVRFGQYFHGKPVILALVYYACPMLCNRELNDLTSALQKISLNPGQDFEVIAVSFDQRETPAIARLKKASYVQQFNRPGTADGWHFLTGNAVDVRKLAESVGFHYEWDNMTNQFAHGSGIMVLTPEGRVSKYFYGLAYKPRDLRLGLVEASANKIGTPVDRVLLLCFHYDPATGKYGFVVMNVLRGMAAATVFAIGAFMIVMLRRDRRET